MSERHHHQRQVSTNRRVVRAAILLLAFFVRAISLDVQGLWRDEVDQWRFALQPWGEMARNFTRPGWNGPLFSPLLRVWIGLTGESVYAMRYFSLLCGVVCVALVYVLAKRLLDDRVAGWSALLLALSPYMVWYAQEIKMYTWVPMLALLALYALDRACGEYPPLAPPTRGGRRAMWWLVVLVTTSLAFYSHILAALLIPVEVVWFLLCPHRHRQAWRGGVVVLVLLTVPYLPLVGWQVGLLSQTRETGYPAYTLWQMFLVPFTGWTAGVYRGSLLSDAMATFSAAFLGAVALLGGGGLVWGRRGRRLGVLLGWIIIPIFAIWLVSLRGPIFTDRYVIWAAPAFTILAASGLAMVQSRARELTALLLLCVALLNGSGLYHQAAQPLKPQFEPAARYLEAHRDPDDLLLFLIPQNAGVVFYYAGRSLPPHSDAPFTNWRRADGGYEVGEAYVDAKMAALTASYDGVWLVYSEAALWDDRGLVKAWLDDRGTLVERQDYVGVSLFRYALRTGN